MRQQQCHICQLGYGSHFRKTLIFLLLLSLLSIPHVSAQTSALNVLDGNTDSVTLKPQKKNFIKRVLSSFNEVDTNYVKPNKYHMQGMLYSDLRFNVYNISATNNETQKEQSITFSPYSTIQAGPYFGYTILFLGYTLNFGHKQTNATRSNTHLSIYSPLFGIDYFYQKGESNYQITRTQGFSQSKNINNISFSGLDTYLQHLHLYYVFNHKRFSYTAAYSQSRQQIRSSGSFMLGFNYTQQRLNFDYNSLPIALYSELIDELKMTDIHYNNYSISVGYSYNWAFAKNWLFNITFDPSIGYNINKGEKMELNSRFLYNNFNFDLISRSALVWNTGHYYAGVQAVAHTYSYKKSTFAINNAQYDINAYIGLNFWRKKSTK